MKTINEFKDLLRKMERDVLRKSNALEYDSSYYCDIFLESVEEDIALWKKGNGALKDYCYFYTDLEGNLLFNGEKFSYATPFSNLRACVNNYREWLILDLERKEKVSFPDELEFVNINKFRNDGLVLFDKNSLHWGSIRYNPYEGTFEKDIPFIWDALEFSRLQGQVYVGIHSVSPIRNNDPYFHWSDDFGSIFTIEVMRLPIDLAKNLDCYNHRKKAYTGAMYQNVIRYIEEEISNVIPKENRNQIISNYLKTAYNIGDYYFEEKYNEEANNNKGKIVDVENSNIYQKKLGKLIK